MPPSPPSNTTPEPDHDHNHVDSFNQDLEETDTDTITDNRLHVAIIGSGITGLTLALALSARGVQYTLYERSRSLREIGAGIGLSPNAERALCAIDPRAHAVFKRVAAPSSSGGDWFEWVDGTTDQLAFRLSTRVSNTDGKDGGGLGEAFQGCRRSDLLEGLAKLVEPEGRVRFGKAVDTVEGWGDEEGEDGGDGKVVLRFRDGTTEEADVVVGCDGIYSRVRQLLLGEDNPASYSSYTQKFCFRTILPMAEVLTHSDIVHRVKTRVMFNGPGAHVITYPIGAKAEILNVLFVISDPSSSNNQNNKRPTATIASKREAIAAFKAWHPTIRSIVDLLPDDEAIESSSDAPKALRWDIYDMHEHPVPYYTRGRVCLAGDAAHGSSPHLGSGAAFGIEDALALASVLEVVDKEISAADKGVGVVDDENSGKNGEEAEVEGRDRITKRKSDLCCAALAAYNDVRYERTQWLPGASREACALFQWEGEAGRRGRDDPGWFGEEITRRFYNIWNYDVDDMVRNVLSRFRGKSE